jgi:GNAT superfamily N-acetyltransferase
MPEWEIQHLNNTHDRAGFDCGLPGLNEWLQVRAGQFARKDLLRTFVATRPTSREVLGFYALAIHRILHEDLPPAESKGLPKHEIPVVLLGQLGVTRSAQGLGLGKALLVDALRRSATISLHVGVRAVEVDATDAAAVRFYEKFGFRPLLDSPQHLLMPMHQIRKLQLTHLS